MRGRNESQVTMLSLVTPDQRVPKDHPLRKVKTLADGALAALSPTFDEMYSKVGRPSIPPERLLKATLLMAPGRRTRTRKTDRRRTTQGTRP